MGMKGVKKFRSGKRPALAFPLLFPLSLSSCSSMMPHGGFGSKPYPSDDSSFPGIWKGGRHATHYFPNGTFQVDPPDGFRGKWRIVDGILIVVPYVNGSGAEVHRSRIVSMRGAGDRQTIVLEDGPGHRYTLRRE